MQSVFNRGECMMHVDKNADGHVLDQNMDRISKESAYVPLSGRIRSKRSSCMRPFFFFCERPRPQPVFLRMLGQTHVNGWSRVIASQNGDSTSYIFPLRLGVL